MTTPPPDKSPDPITPGKAIESDRFTTPKPPSGFESYMQGAPTPPKTAPTPPQGPTPMEIARPPGSFAAGTPTFDSLLGQATQAKDTLGTVAQQLNTPNLKFKRSQSHLLKNKLQDANTYVRSAGGKIGLDSSPMKTPAGANALDRFIAYVNDSQEQLIAVQEKLKELSATGQQLSPAAMMLVQIRMNQAQQEIEYSSTLLGKVVDSLKTIINIQL